MHARTVAPYNRSFETLEKDLQKYRRDGSRVMLLSPSRTRAKRLAQDLTGAGRIVGHEPEHTEISRVGQRKSTDIDARRFQHTGHIIKLPRPILDEY
jgi:hypothetical protein